MVQFKHLRRYDNKGILSTGGITVAIELNDDNLLEAKLGDNVELRVGLAKCMDLDRYVKKIGAKLSQERLHPCKLLVARISSYIKNNRTVIEVNLIEPTTGLQLLLHSFNQKTFQVTELYSRELQLEGYF